MGAKGKSFISIIKRIAWGATIYHLWRQRNSIIHENVYSSGEAIFHLICNEVRLRVVGLKKVDDNHANKAWCERWSFPLLSLALVDRPYDLYPRRVVCGYFARGVAYCGVLGCPMRCPMWCAVGAWFLLRVCLRLGACLVAVVLVYLGSLCPGCGLLFYWFVLLM